MSDDSTDSRQNVRPVYTYEVVTSNGCGVHAKGFATCAKARQAMARIAAAWSIAGDVFEIQRVEHLHRDYSRRYYMRQRSRWVRWHHQRDASERHPDYSVVSEGRGRV